MFNVSREKELRRKIMELNNSNNEGAWTKSQIQFSRINIKS